MKKKMMSCMYKTSKKMGNKLQPVYTVTNPLLKQKFINGNGLRF